MRLIDADALHKAYMELRNFKQDPQSGDWISLRAVPLTTVIRMLNEAPIIEPKRGEWIRSSDIDIAWGSKVYTCSNCGHKRNSKTNFCPNCGADMRGKGDE